MSEAVVDLRDLRYVRDGEAILDHVTWQIEPGQHWAVLGRNGSGKTTLARIAALYEHPSSGSVRVVGETLGDCDVRTVRRRIGFVSSAMADLVRPQLTARDVVMTAKYAALEPWWHTYDDEDRARAGALIEQMGVRGRADHPFRSLSSGERQRVLLARAHMLEPELLIADEPNAGLDLGGREELVQVFDRLAARPHPAPMILVTHHVEEIPTSFTHVLLIRQGTVQAAGPIEDHLTSDALSECFGLPLEVGRHGRRWWARSPLSNP